MDIREFYAGDPRRRESAETTYGDGWTASTDPHATYRLSWVSETGELYAVREPHPGGLFARYLDQLDVDQADVSELTVEVLATERDGARLTELLGGWQDAEGEPDSLAWVRARVPAGAS